MKHLFFTLAAVLLVTASSFVAINHDKSADLIPLLSKAKYVLHVQVSQKDQESQWTTGFTDYHVHAGVLNDYKGNYNEKRIIFNHRANGNTKEESRVNQLALGEEYIVLLDEHFTEITAFEKNKDELKQMNQKVYLLVDSYHSVTPFTSKQDSTIKANIQ